MLRRDESILQLYFSGNELLGLRTKLRVLTFDHCMSVKPFLAHSRFTGV